MGSPQKQSFCGVKSSLIKLIPLHARNIYPYHGEGDKGDRVDK